MGLQNCEARELANRAQSIEDAVYDLKAVNPNRQADVDKRTPSELLDIIGQRGREVAEAWPRCGRCSDRDVMLGNLASSFVDDGRGASPGQSLLGMVPARPSSDDSAALSV